MRIESISVGPLGTNCFIVMDENTNEAIIIDPGFYADKILAFVDKMKADIKYILLTHGHFDHFFAAKGIIQKTNAKLVLHEFDEELLSSGGGFLMFFDKESEVEKNRVTADILVKDGDIIHINDIDLKYIHTPGHTKGSCCILADKSLFSGDTLFYLSAGRTDFPGGSMTEIVQSFKKKLLPLSDSIKVYPGHGEFTEMGYEKRNNMYFGL